MRLLPIVLLTIIVSGCASVPASAPAGSGTTAAPIDIDAAALVEFQEDTDQYAALHQRLEAQLPAMPVQADPAAVHAHEIALGDLIVAARRRARQGDLFGSNIDPLIRQRTETVFVSPSGTQEKAAIQEEQSERRIRAQINTRYPDDMPLSAVPASVLASLPPLPPELQYRFLGRHLILIDIGARIIVDFMPNVLPR